MRRRGLRVGSVLVVVGAWAALAGVSLAADESVGIYDFAFGPDEVVIQAGDSVTWSNGDRVNHSATGSGWDTGALTGGSRSTVVFERPGTFDYVCRFHPAMRGTVVVEGTRGDAAGGPTAPSTDTAPSPGAAGSGAGVRPDAGAPAALLLLLAALVGASAVARRPS